MNTIDEIVNWFEQAVPEPTLETKSTQYGVHLEEISEGLQATGDFDTAHIVSGTADMYKSKDLNFLNGLEYDVDKEGLLDALCDQIVTAIGVSHMFGMDIRGALKEVSRSNNSKFVDGKPLFNEQGKIKKGENYTPPELTPYL